MNYKQKAACKFKNIESSSLPAQGPTQHMEEKKNPTFSFKLFLLSKCVFFHIMKMFMFLGNNTKIA